MDNKMQIFGRAPRIENNLHTISRLYHLPPIAVGTPNVESLTSYVGRLAEAHCISVGTLYSFELIPMVINLGSSYEQQQKIRSMFFKIPVDVAKSSNGVGRTAERWVQALNALTLRTDLSLLTLLTWKNVLTHQALLRSHRAWCQFCLDEQRSKGEYIYELLAWSLKVVTVCVQHECHLNTQCNHCKRKHQPVLSSSSRPGYCSSCRHWLGKPYIRHLAVVGKNELSRQRWVIGQLGRLFSDAQSIIVPPDRVIIGHFISHCVNNIAMGSNRKMARILGLSGGAVSDWIGQDTLPTLDSLLELCFVSEISLSEVLSGTIKNENKAIEPQPVQATKNNVSYKQLSKRWDLSKVLEALEDSRTEYPPASLKNISSRFKCSAAALRYHFPDLCRLISKRNTEYLRGRKLELCRGIEQRLRAALEVRPTLVSVVMLAREFHCTETFILDNFPDLSRKLVRLNEEDRRRKLAESERLLSFAAREEEPPASFSEICRRVGYSGKTLRDNFPELCALIVRRNLHFRRKMKATKQKELRIQIRDLAYKLQAEGIYPSHKNIESRLPLSMRDRSFTAECLRELRKEI